MSRVGKGVVYEADAQYLAGKGFIELYNEPTDLIVGLLESDCEFDKWSDSWHGRVKVTIEIVSEEV